MICLSAGAARPAPTGIGAFLFVIKSFGSDPVTRLFFLQEPLPLIEHEEAAVRVVADERIATEDSPHGQPRLL